MNPTESPLPVRTITFSEAIRLFFTQYATFSGRATRSEYWYWFLCNVIVCGILALLVKLAPIPFEWIQLVYSCGTLIPGFALFTRRMHDVGKRGWAILWGLVPFVGAFVMLAFVCRDSQDDNPYGPRKV